MQESTTAGTSSPHAVSRCLECSLVAASATPAATLPVAVQISENVPAFADSPPLDELGDEPAPEGGTVALLLVVPGHGDKRYRPVLKSWLAQRVTARQASAVRLLLPLARDDVSVTGLVYEGLLVDERGESTSEVLPRLRVHPLLELRELCTCTPTLVKQYERLIGRS